MLENDDSFAREQQQNLSSLMQFLDSPHRETTTNFVPSLHGAQPDIVRTNINYSDDSMTVIFCIANIFVHSSML